ncbi:YggS family pyridoxal phosphate-dependent enzyme [Zeimonas arvi]|uniref:YggS family pyridoxal phosphate-dependent enzyme n=1 Tax=Zeimonas arvi TaxID=2498847 RepID=UPI001CEC5C52|nr:YggS family pyridoxal phosphate-dependent enzyme [Zeimonas arvi]
MAGRLAQLRARIDAAARCAGRDPDSVKLLAVSKTFDADLVLALAELGQRAFGENYVQEAVAKMDACRDRRPEAGLEWHFIGPIQSNKTRTIAERFDWVHSIDREKIATRLGEQRPESLPPLDCCVQVNVSGEASKSGCAPEDAPAVARAIAAQPRLKLRGVMAIPEPTEDLALQRMRFAAARAVLQGLRDELAGDHAKAIVTLDTLSMGMSADLESAVAEGATIVRIGSALFGHRPRIVAG